MVMSMRVNGYSIKHREKALTSIQMVHVSPVRGTRTNKMAMESKHGQMVLAMKVITVMGRKKARVNSIGEMKAAILGNSITIIYMESVNINGLMEGSTRVSGKTIKCMGLESSHGGTGVDIQVNT